MRYLNKIIKTQIKHVLFHKGVTLVELLIVAALTAIVSFAIYSVLNSGIDIWERAREELPEEDLAIFMDRFNTDLRNSFKFDGIAFMGTEDRLEFATLVSSSRLKNRTVGKIIYLFNANRYELQRQQNDYSGAYTQEPSLTLNTLSNIKELNFYYYFYDSQKQEYLWTDEWLTATLPLAVRIEFKFEYQDKENIFSRTVSIPVSKIEQDG